MLLISGEAALDVVVHRGIDDLELRIFPNAVLGLGNAIGLAEYRRYVVGYALVDDLINVGADVIGDELVYVFLRLGSITRNDVAGILGKMLDVSIYVGMGKVENVGVDIVVYVFIKSTRSALSARHMLNVEDDRGVKEFGDVVRYELLKHALAVGLVVLYSVYISVYSAVRRLLYKVGEELVELSVHGVLYRVGLGKHLVGYAEALDGIADVGDKTVYGLVILTIIHNVTKELHILLFLGGILGIFLIYVFVKRSNEKILNAEARLGGRLVATVELILYLLYYDRLRRVGEGGENGNELILINVEQRVLIGM